MQRKRLLYFAFFLFCLMAVGFGNQLRHWLHPEQAPKRENTVFAQIGKMIKGTVRAHLGVNEADPRDEKLVRRGKLIYADYCASCHGANLEGQPGWRVRNEDGVLPAPPHDASGHTWHHPDQLLFDYTKMGGRAMLPEGVKSGMPAFEGELRDGDIWAVLSYIKSTWPEQILTRQESFNPRN